MGVLKLLLGPNGMERKTQFCMLWMISAPKETISEIDIIWEFSRIYQHGNSLLILLLVEGYDMMKAV